MATLQLRSHIPISAPARREPADGTESSIRVSLGFEPAWFHKRCGVDFYERWHRDPRHRYQTLKKMKAELVKTFPTVSYWDLTYEDDLATLSGAYGAYVIPKVFGLPLRYGVDRWPVVDPERRLSVDQIERLEVDKLLQGPFVEELFHQMDIIEAEWGKIHGYLNWQGILNNAFHIPGQEIFLDLGDRPEWVHQFFSTICEVMIRLGKRVQDRQRESGFYINQLSVSNCLINLVSPDVYREFIFPYDSKIALSFERFGVHTCNWDVTPYLQALRDLPNVGYLDMGMASNLAKAKAIFLETRRAVMYSPTTLEEASLEILTQDLERVYRELAPCDVVMADVQSSTSDHRVNEFLDISRRLEAAET